MITHKHLREVAMDSLRAANVVASEDNINSIIVAIKDAIEDEIEMIEFDETKICGECGSKLD